MSLVARQHGCVCHSKVIRLLHMLQSLMHIVTPAGGKANDSKHALHVTAFRDPSLIAIYVLPHARTIY